MAHYVHHIPGRLRIKTSYLKRNEKRAQQVRDVLEGIEGVPGVRINTVTGSLLISYDADLTSADELLQTLKRAGCCCESTELPDTRKSFSNRLADTLSDAGERASKAAVGVLVEKMVERSALVLIGAVL